MGVDRQLRFRGQGRRRVIEGRPWRQALVCALNPEAPYAPWQGTEEVTQGDTAVVVLDTEPQVVLCVFTVRSAVDLSWDIAQEVFRGPGPLPEVRDVDPDGVPMPVRLSKDMRYDAGSPLDQAGDSSAAVSRIVVSARGRCLACNGDVLITCEEDVDRLVHTASEAAVNDGTDWPGLLCDGCVVAMGQEGITSLVDFVFSRRPACPECSAQQARRIGYGMPSSEWIMNMTPWETTGGCVIGPSSPGWSCRRCDCEWGNDD